jgi:hypothetical protein
VRDRSLPRLVHRCLSVAGRGAPRLASVFGTNEMTFPVTTTVTEAVQQTRVYIHFTDAADDVVIARVYEGIHFGFADSLARTQGESVGMWVFKHFLRPVRQNDDDEDR